MNDPGVVEVFHGSNRHGEPPTHPERLVSFRPLNPANRLRPVKVYPDLEPVLLSRRILRPRPWRGPRRPDCRLVAD